MHSHQPRQKAYTPTRLATEDVPADSAARCDRIYLAALLQHHLSSTMKLHGYVHSLELRSRNVSFVDVRRLFHRIGEKTVQCCNFLDARIHYLIPMCEMHPVITNDSVQTDTWYDLSFATCIDHICEPTRSLRGLAAQVKSYMDRAVITGDYDSLHVMTDCINQVSQLVALIQLHFPGESHNGSASPLTSLNDYR